MADLRAHESRSADFDTGGGTDRAEVSGILVPASGGGVLITGDATNGLDVDVTRVPAPLSTTGGGTEATALRVTIANDSTGVVSIDDNGGSITVDGTVAVTGTFWQATQPVSIASLPALAAGTNNIGDVDVLTLPALPAGSNNIGDVDVLSVVPGTAATSLGKAIDTAAGATDTGVAVLAVRDDALTTLTPVDGDYVPLRVGSTGALHVTVTGSVAVTGTFWQATQPVSGTFWQATQPVSIASLPALAAGTNNIGDIDVLSVPAPLSTTGGGTEATALRVTVANDSTGVLSVDDNGSTLSIDDGAGSLTIDDGGGAITVDGTVNSANTAGDVAHGSADSGNPVKVGLKAASALPTAESNNDRVNGIADLWGRQLVSHIDPGMQTWKSANYTTTQTGSAIWTPAGGKRIAITSIVISSYGTTAGRVLIWFGASGDTTYSAGTDQLVLPFNSAPSATAKPGIVFTPGFPIFAATADHILRITSDAGISVDIAVYGYEF